MKCPICKRDVDDKQRDAKGSPYPFCTERCKLIDLGRWLSDAYQVPVEETDPTLAHPDQDRDNRET
jgi:endogenous inhibitor of DNA gyrase (YacG/DUF329 family)